jgi:hypothetical protein
MALIVDAVKVELTIIVLAVTVLPRMVLAFSVVICMVDAVIVDAEIASEESVLPTNVENPMFIPLTVDAVIDEKISVLP